LLGKGSMEVPTMCYRDKNEVAVVVGDKVEYAGLKYVVKFIEEYDFATVVIAENIKTRTVETLLLQDIKKI
jgi:ribosomal protein L7Ae-like RNA K-turn-binding protein